MVIRASVNNTKLTQRFGDTISRRNNTAAMEKVVRIMGISLSLIARKIARERKGIKERQVAMPE